MSEVNKQRKPRKKLTKFAKRLLDIILVLSLCTACFSGYMLYKGKKEYKVANKAYGEVREAYSEISEKGREIGWDALWEVNPYVVAWIYLEDSSIDYPVIHYTDNDFYLRRLLDGTWNNAGTIMVDAENSPGFIDKNNVFYGHHMMEEPFMFADIEKYKDQSFYDTHKVIELFTPEKKYLIYPVAGMFETGTGDYIQFKFSGEKNFLEYVNNFVENSTFVSDEKIEAGDKLALFSTCEYKVHTVDGRYALIGKMIEDKDWRKP